MRPRTDPSQLDEVARVFRESYGHAVATLVRVFGDISVAEDAVQDAFVVAARRWPAEGIPPNPAGWIVTTARHRAIDQLRRSARGRQLEQRAAVDPVPSGAGPEPSADTDRTGGMTDDRLRLIFTCCHPALRREHQVALTLRLLGGIPVEEIARAFLVGEAAMAKRLTRAKYKIRSAAIPYRIPAPSDLPGRLDAALSVLYLIYNAGTADLVAGAALRFEAIRLARALAELMPDHPEADGLLALLLLNESRVPARNARGAVVLLRDQDRTMWDRDLIGEGHAIIRRCIRTNQPGPLQVQAAVQAVHCDAATFESTDWPQIVALYDHLFALLPTPVVALNRAIAVSETEGPEAALAILEAIAPELDDYHLLHAARAEALRRLGWDEEARASYRRAAELAPTDADRDHLRRQAAAPAKPTGDREPGPENMVDRPEASQADRGTTQRERR